MPKTTLPYGLWSSPLTPRSLAGDKRLSEVQWDSDGRTLVWLEGRSDRGVLVALADGDDAPRDLTSDLSVRAEVGYGGGDFTVHGGYAYFVVHKTGRIYRQPLAGGAAKPITPAFGQAASPVVLARRPLAWPTCITIPSRSIGSPSSMPKGKHWPRDPRRGARLLHAAAVQPRRQAAWPGSPGTIPTCPGTARCLYVADDLACRGLEQARAWSPAGKDVAIFQPEFTPDGKQLLYVSDESGFGPHRGARTWPRGKTRWLTPEGCGAQPARLGARHAHASPSPAMAATWPPCATSRALSGCT